MNRRLLSVLVAVVVIVIILIMVLDFSGNQAGRRGDNPYAYEVDRFKSVDPELVGYAEKKNIPLGSYNAGAIDLDGERIWIAGENVLLAMDESGKVGLKTQIEGSATCIEVSGGAVYLGFEDHLEKYDLRGNRTMKWESPGERTVFTSLAMGDGVLYAADAGNRRVLRYDTAGNLIGQFEGKAEENALGHGFIVPSASFDLIVNSFGELWVVNPGMHAIENYSAEGEMRGYWQKISMQIEGFTGCCNPAEIDVLEDGSFITSEKGLVRIKVYDQSGKLLSVVAPPEKFREEGKAPEVKADPEGRIFALDFDRNTIRIFDAL